MDNFLEIIEQLQDAAETGRDIKIICDDGKAFILKTGATFIPTNDIRLGPCAVPLSQEDCRKRTMTEIIIMGWTPDFKAIMKIYSSRISAISLI